MAGRIDVNCPICQATYRLSEKLAGKRVRCKVCKEAFHVTTLPPPASPSENFDDTVVGWLSAIDEAERHVIPQPRIISSRSDTTDEPAGTTATDAAHAGRKVRI